MTTFFETLKRLLPLLASRFNSPKPMVFCPPVADRRREKRHLQITRRAILRGFAPVIAILFSDAKRNIMLNNILQPAPRKRPGQKPLNRESYSISLASARNHPCKSR